MPFYFAFPFPDIERGVSYLKLRPDRVAMQDATAQMAIIQVRNFSIFATLVDECSCPSFNLSTYDSWFALILFSVHLQWSTARRSPLHRPLRPSYPGISTRPNSQKVVQSLSNATNLDSSSTNTVEQGRIHGYPSRVWVGRGHISGGGKLKMFLAVFSSF